MKKILFLVALAITMTAGYAQQDEIIYRDFEPDSTLAIYDAGFMLIDLDGEGSPDIKMSYFTESPGAVFSSIESCYPDSIMLCATEQGAILSEIEEWSSNLSFEVVLVNQHYGFRIKHNESFFYGWFETYLRWTNSVNNQKRVLNWCVDRTAFCTIPNYPLQWGQTELLTIEENGEPTAFATIHPNPTNGLVTIIGENLRQAEVINMLGQQVLSVQGNGNELHFDMTTLPTGVYFITITDDEGRKCVRKVVKE